MESGDWRHWPQSLNRFSEYAFKYSRGVSQSDFLNNAYEVKKLISDLIVFIEEIIQCSFGM